MKRNRRPPASPRARERPRHKLIERLAASVGETGMSEQLSKFAWLLLDQARIVEGEQIPDPPAFARRLAALLNAACRRRGDAPPEYGSEVLPSRYP